MHTFRLLFPFALAATLAACASPSAPTGSKTTKKSPEDYAACVLPKWQAIAPLTVQKSINNGYRLTVPSALASDEVLEVVKHHDGSLATFYKGGFFAGDKLRQAARDCLD
ncbi:hypothetical protein [Pseudomonas sp. Teo4]|uniref:hypothetical protein n=1 Tax=Pseudomonas sp. Teo4 TaxID=3064528 RepID=UPI002ABBD81C|nr:hypothetical protein [Pseudomonas sp. Teo4]MDZ3992229.1 hypothetical protein [Pseudomonas sp. Teo4]